MTTSNPNPDGHVVEKPEAGGTLPDGSGFFVMSFPLPEDHWLYAPRPEGWDSERNEAPDCPYPFLTRELQAEVVAAIRWAYRAATDCGRLGNTDPDALVQNAVYALCGPVPLKPKRR